VAWQAVAGRGKARIVVRYGWARRGGAGLGAVRPGTAWIGVGLGTAGRSEVRHGSR